MFRCELLVSGRVRPSGPFHPLQNPPCSGALLRSPVPRRWSCFLPRTGFEGFPPQSSGLYLVGGFNPSEKYLSNWIVSPGRGENKKCLKPPPSYDGGIFPKRTMFTWKDDQDNKACCIRWMALSQENKHILKQTATPRNSLKNHALGSGNKKTSKILRHLGVSKNRGTPKSSILLGL